LYENFSKQQVSKTITNQKTLTELNKTQPLTEKKKLPEKSHIFNALKYLRKLCNHPCFVLNEQHSLYPTIKKEIDSYGIQLNDILLSPKLLSLKQLLNDCGIGETTVSNLNQPTNMKEEKNEMIENTKTNHTQHRVLIFCQLKQMLDIIENELFKKWIPSVTYLRLDGDVNHMNRYGIVEKFNQDPTIDVLLLTKKIGGLGLDLTGADTIIFVAHD
jgi:TATA-binding protein-associated factor